MTKEQRQVVIFGVLLIVCALVYWRPARQRAPRGGAATVSVDTSSSVRPIVPPVDRNARLAQRALAKELAWERDPFLPAASGIVSGLHLSGIMWDPANPLAIINGVAVAVGESLEDGLTIAEIHPDRVILSDGTTRSDLLISPE